MSSACEAHDLIGQIAGAQALGSPIKTALSIVARRTGLTERRVRGIWHREARAIRAEELDALRRAAEAQKKAEFDAEISELRARLARLEAASPVAAAHALCGASEGEGQEVARQGRVVAPGRLNSPTGPRFRPEAF
ncbi:hypothetical protein [Ancylobacter sp. IITR112]|uniref:hypothetical protein n=1 Tax=Ancylobacter sp. IITR112 TaxID=3138073 RepID=UPI00352A1023